MKIEITYNNGEKYTAYLADESYENVIACLMDDVLFLCCITWARQRRTRYDRQ